MSKSKFFPNNIEPSCIYCRYGRFSADKAMILCEYKGVIYEPSSCRRFIYDPLKREPKRQRQLPKYDKSDFEL